MSLSSVLEREGGMARANGDDDVWLFRSALLTVALGVVMLLLPTLAAFQDPTQFAAYYLHPTIAAVWVVGLALDVLVVVSLLERRLQSRRWLRLTAAALLALAALPWLELYLGTLFDYGAVRAQLPLPWATTHLGPVGSVMAAVGAVLALRGLRDSA